MGVGGVAQHDIAGKHLHVPQRAKQRRVADDRLQIGQLRRRDRAELLDFAKQPDHIGAVQHAILEIGLRQRSQIRIVHVGVKPTC